MILTKEIYSEVYEVLNIIGQDYINKIPKKIVDIFNEKRDKNYISDINENTLIYEDNLKEETLIIIALLNLEYWCDDEEEKNRLKEIYLKNEEKYEKELSEKYSVDNLFKNRNNETIENNGETVLVSVDPVPAYKRIFNKIKEWIYRFRY